MEQKVNILMVDDQPGKLLTYEAILGELGENLRQGIFRKRSTGTPAEDGHRRRADGCEHA